MCSEMPPDRSERRYRARLRLALLARLQTRHGICNVQLGDLSEGGAKLVMQSHHPLGPAVLQWLDCEAFGEMVWRRGNLVGIKFETPLALGLILRMREFTPTSVRDGENVRRKAEQSRRL